MAENSKELQQILWDGADILRSKMDANDYKDYLLGFVFYKYLSDTLLTEAYKLLEDTTPLDMATAQRAYEEAMADQDEDFIKELKQVNRYLLKPELTYTKLSENVGNNCFQREDLQQAFNEIEQSDKLFDGLFTDVDLYSPRLGTGDLKQTQTIEQMLVKINEANLLDYSGDVLGDAYEYMIGQFASETGKKAGEFYTPRAVSEILARVTTSGQEDVPSLTVYDPAMGSASLLLSIKNYVKNPNFIQYYGQELVTSTYNLARMNMFLHGISPDNQHLRNGDTLDADWPVDQPTTFHCVVMNPPYSQKWTADSGFLTDPRFSDYGVLPPKSKADYAFLLHGYYHLKDTGTMAIVLPHGVLFRGAAEGKIRQKLLENGAIYAVIGLPSNLFYNTSIPTTIVVLKKRREDAMSRDVLFIDASKEFEHGKKQNSLTEAHIDAILKMYHDRKDVDKHAHLATFEEIQDNDFNLNIPRYVDTFEKEPDVDLAAVAEDIAKLDDEIASAEQDVLSGLKDLTAATPEAQKGLDMLLKLFMKEGR